MIYNVSDFISSTDIILLPIYLFIIFIVSTLHKNKKIEKNPIYKYYLWGLFLKIIGGIIFCFIYVYYYKAGDSIGFFENANAIGNLLLKDPLLCINDIFSIQRKLLDDLYASNRFMCFYCKESELLVAKFYVPFVILGFKRYLTTTVFVAWISYLGIWKLLLVFCEQFPNIQKRMVISIIFIPSLIFWGSGMLKDTITFSSACWFTYAIYNMFVKREKIRNSIFIIISSAAIIITIKPYIMVALLPASIIWASYNRIKSIESGFLRTMASPFLIIFGVVIGVFALSMLGSSLDTYSSAEKIIEKATVTREDLIRSEQYGSNFYDIGKFEATPQGLLKKAPEAIIAGLFRPFLWDVKNPIMLMSGLENLYILCLFLYILFRVGPRIFVFIANEPLLFFSVVFSLVFAFAVGLTTANYGALVRYRIPALPFFVSSLFILLEKVKEYRKQKNQQ